ncbi:GSCOCG00013526001-RA-CDS [Cotesia congregata]|uniref:Uncharacterized protein n=1 Tax=Cotesia congregata TaxID=51543 RepID=A0A8J2H5T3_COTCN|nr:GSCOCG00013526001-RA-CDS [Cotesia congregata]CAG5076014.1 Protein of unknown function [Cotesia congregata]
MDPINEAHQSLSESMLSYWLPLLEMYNIVIQRVKLTQKYYNDLYFHEREKTQNNSQNYTGDPWFIEYALIGFYQNFDVFSKKLKKCIDKIQREIDKVKIILSKKHFKTSFNFVNRFNQSVRYLNRVIEFLNKNEFKIDNIVLSKSNFLKPLEVINNPKDESSS